MILSSARVCGGVEWSGWSGVGGVEWVEWSGVGGLNPSLVSALAPFA